MLANQSRLRAEQGELWAAVSPGGLIRFEGSGDVVVFHELTGETHVLNELSALVLNLVEHRPCAVQDITEACARRWPGQANLVEVLVTTLNHLADAELVEVVVEE